jgi:hypothetical protein
MDRKWSWMLMSLDVEKTAALKPRPFLIFHHAENPTHNHFIHT